MALLGVFAPGSIYPWYVSVINKRLVFVDSSRRKYRNVRMVVCKKKKEKKKETRELMRRHCSRFSHIREEQRYRHLHLQFKRCSPGIIRAPAVWGKRFDNGSPFRDRFNSILSLHLGQGARYNFSISSYQDEQLSLSLSSHR